MGAILVEPEISRSKLQRELDDWYKNEMHRDRGWLLLGVDMESLEVELAFLSKVSVSSPAGPLPIVVCAVRLRYDNYDLWPPSLTFIDVFTRQPSRPHVRALQPSADGQRDVLIDGHPETNLPFLCLAGIREYHTHPQHTGDSWPLHRQLREGSLSTICDRIWRYMANNVLGINVQMQALPTYPLRAKIDILLAQGEFRIGPQPQPAQPQAPHDAIVPSPAPAS